MGFRPLIEAANIKRPLISLKSRRFPRGRVNDMVGLPKTPIDENHVIMGHDLCFDKMCHWMCLKMRNEAVKRSRIIIRPEHNVSPKKWPIDVTYFKYCCFLQLRVVRVKQGRIQLLCAESFFGVCRRQPACRIHYH